MKRVYLYLLPICLVTGLWGESLSLGKGWNLVGVNSDLTLTELKTEVGVDNLLIVQGQHKTYQKSYEDDNKGFLNDFLNFEKGIGYWIKVDNNVSFDYTKDTYTTEESVSLVSGWNIINPLSDLTLSEIQNQIGTDTLEVIQGREKTYQKAYVDNAQNFLNDFTNFEEPNGYWIKVSQSATLSFNDGDRVSPTRPSITTVPSTTTTDITSVEINGEVGSKVFVDGVEVATVGSNGAVNVDLNTSGADGVKSFVIILQDTLGNSSQTLSFSIEKITITRANALKFLRQSAFRSNETEITYVMENGYEAWIDNQFSLVGDLDSDSDTKYGYLESSLRMLNKIDSAQYPTSTFSNPTLLDENLIDGKRITTFRGSVFWDKALHDENQLRQRVAYALSQILVVSDVSPAGQATTFRGESISQYYDILYKHSFGNYRELLTDVTHSSAMGYFMTYIGSKADAPDENYARELTQLFTIGLYELNDDGTLQGGGAPIPSYNQDHVTNLSKVFTGWDLDDLQPNSKGVNARYGSTAKTDNCWACPLEFTVAYHDITNKTILNNQTVTGSTDGSAEIEQALNALFANHNVAPFISRHLIMRLVTSNPTPAYVGRISAVFNNNGTGVKGDLKAVVKAILLDPEARGVNAVANFGKVDEMLVAFPHFLSAFDAHPIPQMRFSNGSIVENVYWLAPDKVFEQGLLAADSVFNFYSNEFVPSDPYFATNNLVAPELQIQNTPNLIEYSNLVKNLMQDREQYQLTNKVLTTTGKYDSMEAWATAKNFGQYTLASGLLYLNLTAEYEVFEKALDNEAVANGDFANMGEGTGADANRTRAINALIDHLDHKLLGGTMPQAYKTALLEHLESLNYLKNDRNRAVRARAIIPTAIQAIVTSPLFMVLK